MNENSNRYDRLPNFLIENKNKKKSSIEWAINI